MLLEIRMAKREFIERLAYGRSLYRHRGLPGHKLTQGGRNVNLHSSSSLSFSDVIVRRDLRGPAVNSVRAITLFLRFQTACRLRPFRRVKTSWSARLCPFRRW